MKKIAFFLVLLTLAGCSDEAQKAKVAQSMIDDARSAAEEFKAAFDNNNIEEAKEISENLKRRFEDTVSENFNSDNCFYLDDQREPCWQENGKKYDGSLGEGIAWNMERTNNAIIAMSDRIDNETNVGAFRKWDDAGFLTIDFANRFIISDYQNPSWQDVVVFNLLIRPALSDASAYGNLCSEAKAIAENEFERQKTLTIWLDNTKNYNPQANDKNNTFRGVNAIYVGDYSFDSKSFQNKEKFVSRGRWSFERENNNLIAQVVGKNDLERGSLGWMGTNGNCSVSYSDISNAVQENNGETINIPKDISLQVTVKNAANDIFMDIPIAPEVAENLISRYKRIGDRMVTQDRQIAAYVFYEIDPRSVTKNIGADSITIKLTANPKNVTFYGFSNADWYNYGGYAGMFGEESISSDEKIPDSEPLYSRDIDS